ncbi:MAG: class I SAM-dependent methyltransferase [Gemmatimonadetes bacterium]|nr:class I SAM-dependent methyltransferase [Gemmatimonadota bacterium]
MHSLSIDTPTPAAGFEQRPSYWFTSHASLIGPGRRVLDLACGAGRHAIAAALLGAEVVAVDRDPSRLSEGQTEAKRRRADLGWVEADLERTWPDFGQFDVVLLFNYLDRQRMPLVAGLVKPGGVLLFETFLEIQRQLGWGPQQPAHLLKFGEIAGLVAPLTVRFGREAFEPADNAQWAAVASVVAQRTK